MEEAICILAEIIKNFFNWINWTAVSTVCSAISLTSIYVLLKERLEKKRPYLQVSFELIKSNLVCLVIRNVGEVPARLQGISFSQDFIRQLPEKGQNRAQNRDNLNISIHPQKQWVICLGVTLPNVLNYENRQLEINLKYSHRDKCKEYEEKEVINFNDYDSFIVYISETDELKNEIKNICKSINGISKELRKSNTQIQTDSNSDKTF